MRISSIWNRACGYATLLIAGALILQNGAQAAEPIRVGMSMALTGGVAPIGKQVLTALQIWRDDINAKGGLLGRPVELVFYDDQSNPANIPQIYTKLIEVDKVELLIGPYATNMVAPAIPVLMQFKKTTIGILANAANSKFHYDQYFSMLPTGPEPQKAFSRGLFELAAAAKPRPKTVAIVAADAEFAQNAAAGIGLIPKMFGGTFIGLLVTPIKMQLGPLLNGIINNEVFVPAPAFTFPGTLEVLAKYQAIARREGLDPMGWAFPPLGYAAGQVLAQAVEGTKSLDHARLAAYMRSHAFSTVVGEITFGKDGEWTKSRVVFTQFQHVTGNTLDQFKDTTHEVVVWPEEYKSGDMIYPYADARNP